MEARSRQERIALNEVAFRAANEALRANRHDPDGRGLDPRPFLCECGDRTCTRVIEIPLDAYAEVREHPARFLVLPGHVDADAEHVVDEADGYETVEKHGIAGEIARAHWMAGARGRAKPEATT
jgi:hypothetical protein